MENKNDDWAKGYYSAFGNQWAQSLVPRRVSLDRQSSWPEGWVQVDGGYIANHGATIQRVQVWNPTSSQWENRTAMKEWDVWVLPPPAPGPIADVPHTKGPSATPERESWRTKADDPKHVLFVAGRRAGKTLANDPRKGCPYEMVAVRFDKKTWPRGWVEDKTGMSIHAPSVYESVATPNQQRVRVLAFGETWSPNLVNLRPQTPPRSWRGTARMGAVVDLLDKSTWPLGWRVAMVGHTDGKRLVPGGGWQHVVGQVQTDLVGVRSLRSGDAWAYPVELHPVPVKVELGDARTYPDGWHRPRGRDRVPGKFVEPQTFKWVGTQLEPNVCDPPVLRQSGKRRATKLEKGAVWLRPGTGDQAREAWRLLEGNVIGQVIPYRGTPPIRTDEKVELKAPKERVFVPVDPHAFNTAAFNDPTSWPIGWYLSPIGCLSPALNRGWQGVEDKDGMRVLAMGKLEQWRYVDGMAPILHVVDLEKPETWPVGWYRPSGRNRIVSRNESHTFQVYPTGERRTYLTHGEAWLANGRREDARQSLIDFHSRRYLSELQKVRVTATGTAKAHPPLSARLSASYDGKTFTPVEPRGFKPEHPAMLNEDARMKMGLPPIRWSRVAIGSKTTYPEGWSAFESGASNRIKAQGGASGVVRCPQDERPGSTYPITNVLMEGDYWASLLEFGSAYNRFKLGVPKMSFAAVEKEAEFAADCVRHARLRQHEARFAQLTELVNLTWGGSKWGDGKFCNAIPQGWERRMAEDKIDAGPNGAPVYVLAGVGKFELRTSMMQGYAYLTLEEAAKSVARSWFGKGGRVGPSEIRSSEPFLTKHLLRQEKVHPHMARYFMHHCAIPAAGSTEVGPHYAADLFRWTEE